MRQHTLYFVLVVNMYAVFLLTDPTVGQEYNQRIGVTTDQESYYRYYNTPPTRQQLLQQRANLDRRKMQLDAERSAIDRQRESASEAIRKGNAEIAKNNAVSAQAYADMKRDWERMEEAVRQLGKQWEEYAIARDAPTQGEYIQRLGSSVSDFSYYKYYDDQGRLSPQKMEAQYSTLNQQGSELTNWRNTIKTDYEFTKLKVKTRRDELQKWYDEKMGKYLNDLKSRTNRFNARLSEYQRASRELNDEVV